MLKYSESITIQKLDVPNRKHLEISIKREDLIHKEVSGNKLRKLKYNLEKAKKENHSEIITFGGAFSNHICATAAAGKLLGIKTIGFIRGEELKGKQKTNPTLSFASNSGMTLVYISRADYKLKTKSNVFKGFTSNLTKPFIIPEGGTNKLAIKGCMEILNEDTKHYDYICTSVGTGGTISGIINASEKHQEIIGFSALKGDFLKEDISKFASKDNWVLNTDYHFGGYAKINKELIEFINTFKATHNIPLDPIYTGKMLFGIKDLISKDYFKVNSKILVIHTGGLQGIEGMNKTLINKKLPLIL